MRLLQMLAGLLIPFGLAFVIAGAGNYVIPALCGGTGAVIVGVVFLQIAERKGG